MTSALLYIKSFLILTIFFNSKMYSQNYVWSTLTNSPTSILSDVYFINQNTGWTADTNVFKTTNGGLNWILLSPQISKCRSIGFFDENTGIVGTLDTAKPLFRTTNGGLNWLIIPIDIPKPKGICGISIVNENTGYISGNFYSDGKAYKTTNKGVTWSLVFNDTSLAKTLIDCYFWSPDSGLIVGGYGLPNQLNAVVLLTSNGGNSWERVYRSNRVNEWCWKISFINKQIGYISIENPSSALSYFLKTTNGGFNWSEFSFSGLNQQSIGFINEMTGWIGGYPNVPCMETTDGGLNWHSSNWGSYVNRIRRINDTLAYASGRRIYKYSRVNVGVHSISSEIPESFSLSQNYPNPFNPSTKISFGIHKQGLVTLKVFDMLGSEVRTLVNESLQPGTYETDFDASGLPGGVYFYRIMTEDFFETRKMILTK